MNTITFEKDSPRGGVCSRGVCLLGGVCWGVSAPGGSAPRGVSAPGGLSTSRGVCSRGCLLWGVSVPGGGVFAPGGCVCSGGMSAPHVDRQTPVKT